MNLGTWNLRYDFSVLVVMSRTAMWVFVIGFTISLTVSVLTTVCRGRRSVIRSSDYVFCPLRI